MIATNSLRTTENDSTKKSKKDNRRMQFEGKNAVITGGFGAMGLTITRHFFCNGFDKIALLDIDYSEDVMLKLLSTFPAKTIIFHLTDVTNRRDLERSFEDVMCQFKSIDCVITCAATLDEINYKRTLDVNLLGVIETNYVAMHHMTIDSGHNGGLIVNISSVAGVDCSHYSMPVYTATKHGVVAFTRSMGVDYFYQKTGIKFVTVCPGQTFTPFLYDLSEKMFSAEAFEVNKIEIKHVLTQTVDEFAEAFIEVLKVDKNGSVWIIDGGIFKELMYSRPWYDIAVQSTPN